MSDSNANQDPNQNEPDHIRDLRQRAESVPTLEAQNTQKEREIEFLRAGVNTGTLFGKNVMAQHGDKEITPEAIAETVATVRTELGLPDPTEGNEGGDGGNESPESQFTNAQNRLGEGGNEQPGTPSPIPDKSAIDLGADRYEEARKQGMSDSDAQDVAIGEIIKAGAQGHTEVAWPKEGTARAEFARKQAEAGHGAPIAGLPERQYGV